MDSRSVVRQFVVDTFFQGEQKRLSSPASPLVADRAMDSVDLLEVSTFLEAYFGIEIDDAELLAENLGSVDAITAFVERKLAQQRRRVA